MKKTITILDFIFAFIFFVAGCFLLFPIFVTGRIYKWLGLRNFYSKHRLIWITSASYQKAVDKGCKWGVLPYHTTFNGYFDKNFIINLTAEKFQVRKISENVYFYDYPIILRKFIVSGNFRYSGIIINVMSTILFFSIFIFLKKVDLVCNGSAYYNGINTALFSIISGCPYYFSPGCNYELDIKINGLPKYMPSEKIVFITLKFIVKFAYCFSCIRKDLKESLVKIGALEKKIKVIYNSIDISLYDRPVDPSKFSEFSGNYTIVYAGRINRVNVIHHIIMCAELVYKKIPNVKFVILGGPFGEDDKKYLNECRIMIKEKKLEEFVFMPGINYSNDDVSHIKRLCNVNLITMGGLSLIESAASKKPVVVYDYDWHSELIKDHFNGILVEYNNYQKMADAIYELYSDPELSKSLSEKAYDTVIERHTIKKEIENYINFYDSVYEGLKKSEDFSA